MAPKLRVAILADALGTGGGIDRYITEVLRGLGARTDVDLVVAAAPGGMETVAELAPRAVGVVTIRGRGQMGRALWQRERLGAHLERFDVGVVHGTKHILPRTRAATVLTAHDVTLLRNPAQFSPAKRFMLPRQYRAALHRATVVIAVSETTRRRLVEVDPALSGVIVVVPNGIGPTLTEVVAEPLEAVGGRRFVLAVGDLSPRKNLDMLLDIWEDVYRSTGLILLIVGPDGWRSTKTRRRVEDFVARGLVLRPGRITDAELRWCYEQASVVAYPSLEEGYGLPVAEALVLGAAVVASTDDALVEVGRGRPTHVDAGDRAGWRHALVELAGRNRVQSEAFSVDDWSDAIEGTIAAYRLAVEWRHRS